MGSKSIIFLGLLLTTALLITSEVIASDLANKTSTSTEQTIGVEDFGGGIVEQPYPPPEDPVPPAEKK